MRKLFATALFAIAAGAGSVRAADDQSFELVQRGRYLATAADCVACHTAPRGAPFSGGLPLETPFGVIVTPNITPDKDTGIGSWTDAEFIGALHDGRGRGGKRLFPAMPYPSYTKLSVRDALAIRAYLNTIEPASKKIDVNQLPFPISWRFNMAVWNLWNFTPGRIEPDASKTPEWNRGRYLVDALGHCGACHTPKTIMGAEKANNYLEGSVIQGWFAPNITADARKGIGAWSDDDIVAYLKTGTNGRTIASGPMAEAVANSTSHMSDPDLKAIAAYLKSLKPAESVAPTPLAPDDARLVAGRAIYKDSCAGCHTDGGSGAPSLFPALAGSGIVQSVDPSTLIRVVLQGSQGVHTATKPTTPAMPSLSWRLNDAQVAAVLTYVRNSWGNSGSPVAPGAVAAARATR
ncbi:c-type cytochrome [Terrarubrum flagellatum]|uniref:c-type cytochrome n=1 Tax=Terrirubrum flagellatum TaxID=2895980 RepID=UPI0031450A3F